MTKLKLAAIALAAAGLATPALADAPTAPHTQRHVIHRSAAVMAEPALAYGADPMVNYTIETPAATGGGSFGYNQLLDTQAN